MKTIKITIFVQASNRTIYDRAAAIGQWVIGSHSLSPQERSENKRSISSWWKEFQLRLIEQYHHLRLSLVSYGAIAQRETVCSRFWMAVVRSFAPSHSLSPQERLFQTIYKENYTKVFVLALHITERFDDAEDIAQEVFSRTWQHIIGCEQTECFCVGNKSSFGWLAQVTKRLAWDSMKRHHQRDVPLSSVLRWEDITSLATWRDDTSRSLRRERLADLKVHVAALPPVYRDVVQSHYLLGYSCHEIAKQMGVSEGTISSRLCRARAMLYEKFVAEESEFIAR